MIVTPFEANMSPNKIWARESPMIFSLKKLLILWSTIGDLNTTWRKSERLSITECF